LRVEDTLLDVSEPRAPRIRDVIEPQEIIEKTGPLEPHTVLCMPGDIITVSMLGDRDGDLPGGLAVIDARDFSVVGQWAHDSGDQQWTAGSADRRCCSARSTASACT
jgi:selenium-binding protein 1